MSRPDILMNPGAFAFNVVPLKQKSTQVITVAYSGRMRGWKITDVGYKKELLDVTVEPLVTRTGVSYQVTATLKGTAPAGTIEEQIVLKTNDPDAQALTLNVSALVQAPLSLSEEPLRMGKVAVGQTKSRRVIVKAEKDFKVVKVDGQGDGVSVPLVPALASKSQVVMVSFTPEKVGAVKKILTIATEDGDTVTLTVEAMAVEAVEPDK